MLIRLALPTRLLDAALSALAKKPHGSSAAYVNSGYGMPSDGIFASVPKNTLKATMVRRGWMMAQAAPSAVCL